MTTQTLLDKCSQRFCLAWEVPSKDSKSALASDFQPAGEAVSRAIRSNQHPRCKKGRLDV